MEGETTALAATVPNKTRAQLLEDLRSGNYLTGIYDAGDRPIVLSAGQENMIGHPVQKRPQINFTGGAGVIAGWVEPKPPEELWTADGGLRLRDNANNDWRISIPNGSYTHPGKGPRFWADISTFKYDVDFSFAQYIWPDGRAQPLFGLWDQFDGPAPIMVLVSAHRVVVYWRDADKVNKNLQAPVINSAPGARNKISVSYTASSVVDGVTIPSKIVVTGPNGTAEAIVNGKLAENIDCAFQIGNGGHTMNAHPLWAPGDLTIYSMIFSHSPGYTGVPYVQPLKIPVKGDWWLGKSAFLHCASKASESWGAPHVKISNVIIRSNGRDNDGASIYTGYSGQGVEIEKVKTMVHHIGIGALAGPSYQHIVRDSELTLHMLAGFVSGQSIIKFDNVMFNRCGRDDCIIRGGTVLVDNCHTVPSGSSMADWPQTVFRLPAWIDPTLLTVRCHLADYESGQTPTLATIWADTRKERFGNYLRISIIDSWFGTTKNFMKLVGTPKYEGQGAYLKLDNVSVLDRAPVVEYTTAWEVVGKIAPRKDTTTPYPVSNPV